MKVKLIIALLAFFLIVQAYSQQQSKCSHTTSFQKSWISDTLDALSYTIHLTAFDFTNHEITAQTDVELASKVDNLYEIKLELMDLTVDDVHIDGVLVPNFQHEDMILSIPLSSPINTGDNILVSVSYHGEPFHEGWGGFHWSGNYAFNLGVGFVSIPHNLGKTWFPCIDDFHDRALYTIFATVPAGKDAVCGGLLEEVVNNGNGTYTFKWSLSQTIPTYLASVAVGDYARWTDTYNGINGDVPIEIWVRPSDSNNVNGSFQNLNAILELYEEKFGPYRFDRVGYVSTAIGFMEHATNIASPHATFSGGLGYETYIAHELAHMWFGDNVTCASAEEMWINEGWATFMDGLYQENLYSREQYIEFMRNKHKNVIQFCHTTSSGYFPLNQIPQTLTYDGLAAYDKGAIRVHTLRGYLGDDIFFDAMAAFNEEYKYSHVTSENMRDFITIHSGIDMTGWFDNWVFHSGTPHYSIDSMIVEPAPGNTDVTVYLRQKRHGPGFIGNGNKFEVTFMDEDWNQHTETVSFDGELGSTSFNIPITPVAAFVDLHELVFDATTDYALTVKQTGVINCAHSFFKLDVQSISDSVFVRVEHNWAPPDGLKTPVQGLILSPYRYWKIDGIIPEGFQAKGVFHYNKTIFLDDGLLVNQNDSLVILYRPGTAFNWQFIPFTKIGNFSVGNLYVDNLQKGEYTLAVCNDTFVGMDEIRKNNGSGLHIFPNPSNGNFNIGTSQPGYLNFFDISGKLIASCLVDDPAKTFTWETTHLDEGTFLVEFQSLNHETIASEKLVLIKN